MNWKSILASLFFATLLLGFAAPVAQAQLPKIGDYYTDDSDLGFRVRMPKDWAFIPPQPGENRLIGKYNHPRPVPVPLGTTYFYLESWLVKFDRRKKEQEEDDHHNPLAALDKQTDDAYDDEDLIEWAEARLTGNNWEIESQKDLKVGKIPSIEYQLISDSPRDPDLKIRAYAMVYKLDPNCEVALVFNGPGDKSKWKSKYKKVYSKMAKSFKRVELKEAKPSKEATNDTPLRAEKRAQLADYVKRTPGWELHETENYFIISHLNDKKFIRDLKERLEAIRAVYMVDYPPEVAEKARSVKALEAARKKKGEEGSEGGITFNDEERQSEDDQPGLEETVAGKVNPMEIARTSVVRVCATRDEYTSYGGPGGSAGYWSPGQQELVIYWDPSSGGKDTWLVLNHEAFHQFIFYFYDQLSPHSWYNEGTGDFYSGYKYKNRKFKVKEAEWRRATASEMISTGKYVPLKEIVRYTQGQYYGNNSYDLGGSALYAQGWSFIYFLRTGKKNARGWQSQWDSILNDYLRVLAETDDLEKAVDIAFGDVDWKAMEKCWKRYMG